MSRKEMKKNIEMQCFFLLYISSNTKHKRHARSSMHALSYCTKRDQNNILPSLSMLPNKGICGVRLFCLFWRHSFSDADSILLCTPKTHQTAHPVSYRSKLLVIDRNLKNHEKPHFTQQTHGLRKTSLHVRIFIFYSPYDMSHQYW